METVSCRMPSLMQPSPIYLDMGIQRDFDPRILLISPKPMIRSSLFCLPSVQKTLSLICKADGSISLIDHMRDFQEEQNRQKVQWEKWNSQFENMKQRKQQLIHEIDFDWEKWNIEFKNIKQRKQQQLWEKWNIEFKNMNQRRQKELKNGLFNKTRDRVSMMKEKLDKLNETWTSKGEKWLLSDVKDAIHEIKKDLYNLNDISISEGAYWLLRKARDRVSGIKKELCKLNDILISKKHNIRDEDFAIMEKLNKLNGILNSEREKLLFSNIRDEPSGIKREFDKLNDILISKGEKVLLSDITGAFSAIKKELDKFNKKLTSEGIWFLCDINNEVSAIRKELDKLNKILNLKMEKVLLRKMRDGVTRMKKEFNKLNDFLISKRKMWLLSDLSDELTELKEELDKLKKIPISERISVRFKLNAIMDKLDNLNDFLISEREELLLSDIKNAACGIKKELDNLSNSLISEGKNFTLEAAAVAEELDKLNGILITGREELLLSDIKDAACGIKKELDKLSNSLISEGHNLWDDVSPVTVTLIRLNVILISERDELLLSDIKDEVYGIEKTLDKMYDNLLSEGNSVMDEVSAITKGLNNLNDILISKRGDPILNKLKSNWRVLEEMEERRTKKPTVVIFGSWNASNCISQNMKGSSFENEAFVKVLKNSKILNSTLQQDNKNKWMLAKGSSFENEAFVKGLKNIKILNSTLQQDKKDKWMLAKGLLFVKKLLGKLKSFTTFKNKKLKESKEVEKWILAEDKTTILEERIHLGGTGNYPMKKSNSIDLVMNF
ncbi:uncharacterized protein LOC120536904 isoform X2 [Polypterus senegalus]|uniref:uncharacterized protein LOC120536904 isoform X2 n=1 Tax=Polypterus senegalus TaxID=55291 RepID=UPI0019657A34|nr:uncharacterized protein LOC120536904 isoform X2 [Polypterus senegalus]